MLSRVQKHTADGRHMVLWEELGAGAPTIVAFARLSSEALASNQQTPREELSEEARAILFAARNRGAIEIKGVNEAFDSSERFLAICVELGSDEQFILKRREEPELTIRFLDGFRQLCASGLVMHHLFRDFSLTRSGFEHARRIQRAEVPILEALATEQVIDQF